MVKQHQQELLAEAELARTLEKMQDREQHTHPDLRESVGDLLINSGLRLKGQPPLNTPSGHTA